RHRQGGGGQGGGGLGYAGQVASASAVSSAGGARGWSGISFRNRATKKASATNGAPTRKTAGRAWGKGSSTLLWIGSGRAWIALMFWVALPGGSAWPGAPDPEKITSR